MASSPVLANIPILGGVTVSSGSASANYVPVLNSSGVLDSSFVSGLSGSGTVTSVGMTVPTFLSVSGSPITSNGTLAISLSSQSANLVLASPNGSSGTPSFRALVAGDIPTLNQNTTGSAAQLNGHPGSYYLTYSNLTGTPTLGSLSAITPTGTPSSTTYLKYDGTTYSWATPAGGTVTSVSFPTTPSWLSASVATNTTTPAISLTATTGQTANRFLATPNGSTGTVGLRAIVAADIPTLNQNTTGTASSATNFSGSLSGDVTGTQSATTVAKFNGQLPSYYLNYNNLTNLPTLGTAAAKNISFFAPATSGSSILYGNGSGGFSAVTIGSGLTFTGGTLSSSSFGTFSSGNLSPLFTTSVANPSTSPALSFTLSTATANTVLAGPTTGSPAAPTYRSLVVGDIPTIAYSTLSGLPTLGTASAQNTSYFLQTANNLSDLASASTARTNLGLGTAAIQNNSFFLQSANNLSDLASLSTARTNLGVLAKSNNLSDVASAATSRTNLGVLAISNNLSDVASASTAIINLGALAASNNLSDLASTSTARTNLGLVIGTNVEQWSTTLDNIVNNTGTLNISGTTLTLPAASVHISNISASGTASSSTYLRGDGSWSSAAGGSGTVTSITASSPLTGGTITSSGTIGLGTVGVANGGTGDITFTTYAPICGGTTSTGALQSTSTGISNSGYVLTSTGSGSLPTFQALPAGVTKWTYVSSNVTAVAGQFIYAHNSNTITLPASPNDGDTVVVADLLHRSGYSGFSFYNQTINGNGKFITINPSSGAASVVLSNDGMYTQFTYSGLSGQWAPNTTYLNQYPNPSFIGLTSSSITAVANTTIYCGNSSTGLTITLPSSSITPLRRPGNWVQIIDIYGSNGVGSGNTSNNITIAAPDGDLLTAVGNVGLSTYTLNQNFQSIYFVYDGTYWVETNFAASNSGPLSTFAIASGTNSYTASPFPSVGAYLTGLLATIKFTNANTGNSTLNLNGLGSPQIQLNGSALTSGQIVANSTIQLVFDGTAFQIIT